MKKHPKLERRFNSAMLGTSLILHMIGVGFSSVMMVRSLIVGDGWNSLAWIIAMLLFFVAGQYLKDADLESDDEVQR
jgi:hypothetical protein